MNARARSRSPRQAQLSSKEIAQLIFAREQARLAKDWSQADNLRSQLHDGGVQLYDKTRLWKCSDGRSGRIPTFDEVEAGQVEPVYEDAKEEVDGSKEEIQSLVLQREQARGSKDFQQADAIRSQLQDLGVELLDKEKLWKCPNRGMQGIITGFRSNELSDVEVHTLVTQREKARMGNDYDLSDMIRDAECLELLLLAALMRFAFYFTDMSLCFLTSSQIAFLVLLLSSQRRSAHFLI
eukprot:s4463_g5.t1